MMFLLRNSHPVSPDLPSISESKLTKDGKTEPKPAATLEGLIAEDPFPIENGDKYNGLGGGSTVTTSKYHNEFGNHLDVAEDEGWITIPKCKVPDDWFHASNVQKLRSLDRSFVFSGEQLHLLVCLSAAKHGEEDTQLRRHQSEVSCSTSMNGNDIHAINAGASECNNQTLSSSEKMGPEHDVTISKSSLQKEDHKLQIETLLEKIRCSNFFVRVAESDEPLWSKRFSAESSSTNSEISGGIFHAKDGSPRKESCDFISAIIDQGSFDCYASGGVARNAKCYSLSSGDIVVFLQVNIAVGNIKDPVLEVLQFEKYGAFVPDSGNLSDLHSSNHYDPCGELLNWLLPLNRTLPSHSSSPPLAQDQTVATHRSTSSYSGSQIFSLGQFRSYSMPSLLKDSAPSYSGTHNSKPSFDIEDLDCFTPEKSKNNDMENEGLFSFRGVSLVPERFSVHCGFEGIYLPGRRWRRKIEIVQPLEIHSFAASCTTEDLLCVQIKNVSPAHLPDITIFLDAITIIYDEPSKGSPPFYLPLSSIEIGGGHTLPNLPLRRGEEHSFILKPVTKLDGDLNGHVNVRSTVSQSNVGTTALGSASKASYLRKIPPSTDQYAVLVSCRSNYTESKLFFKQRMGWRPHIAKDLIISVASEISDQTVGSTRVPQLPVQVLTLHASNLTSEDLNLTVLAPLSSASSTSVVPLSSTPRSPINASFSEFIGRKAGSKKTGSTQRLTSMLPVTEKQKNNDSNDNRSVSVAQCSGATSDFISSKDKGCTHLWLQSTVPLGVVPAHSSTSVKLELLPLTDGIITLDTLQIAARDKGVTYVPEQPLKIYATSSITTGIS